MGCLQLCRHGGLTSELRGSTRVLDLTASLYRRNMILRSCDRFGSPKKSNSMQGMCTRTRDCLEMRGAFDL